MGTVYKAQFRKPATGEELTMSDDENITKEQTLTDDLGTYPIDSVLIRSETRTVFESVPYEIC